MKKTCMPRAACRCLSVYHSASHLMGSLAQRNSTNAILAYLMLFAVLVVLLGGAYSPPEISDVVTCIDARTH